MKLFHISDLHIGIKLHEASIAEDQRYILRQILEICKKEKPDALMIAGDIYDRAVPSAEAVGIFDEFLTGLRDTKTPVFAISGNHDSAERIAYASKIMAENDIFMSPVYEGHTEPLRLTDEFGEVYIYMLPFIKPQSVRQFFDTEISSYDDAVREAVCEMNIDTSKRNVIIAHQFVTGAQTAGDTELIIGGTENISADIFYDFDYAALGHIHKPQKIKRDYIRYSGTPMKYSFSECNDKKGILSVELCEKGTVKISQIPLEPLRDMREVRGRYDELMSPEMYGGGKDDYLHITLTDETDVPYALEKLRTVYKNILRLDYDNARTRHIAANISAEEKEQTPIDLFASLYEKQNGEALNEAQREIVDEFVQKALEVR